MTMQRTLKLYKLPEAPKTPGFRKLTLKDLPNCQKLLAEVSPFYFHFLILQDNFLCSYIFLVMSFLFVINVKGPVSSKAQN